MITNYWEETHNPKVLPINEREAWHRDAWDREQTELMLMSVGRAGNDSPGHVRSFGYGRSAWVHEQ